MGEVEDGTVEGMAVVGATVELGSIDGTYVGLTDDIIDGDRVSFFDGLTVVADEG